MMSEKWKLVYEGKTLQIHNEEGKNLSYNPNSGIQILVDDEYAFKDLNRNGMLDPFEDWRLDMRTRVFDFSQRYHLSQKGNMIYYEKGMFQLPESMVRDIHASDVLHEVLEHDEYLKEHYLLVVLLLMFDQDSDQNLSDYIIQLFLQSLEMGVLDKVFYTIKKAVGNYLHAKEQHTQLYFEL